MGQFVKEAREQGYQAAMKMAGNWHPEMERLLATTPGILGQPLTPEQHSALLSNPPAALAGKSVAGMRAMPDGARLYEQTGYGPLLRHSALNRDVLGMRPSTSRPRIR